MPETLHVFPFHGAVFSQSGKVPNEPALALIDNERRQKPPSSPSIYCERDCANEPNFISAGQVSAFVDNMLSEVMVKATALFLDGGVRLLHKIEVEVTTLLFFRSINTPIPTSLQPKTHCKFLLNVCGWSELLVSRDYA